MAPLDLPKLAPTISPCYLRRRRGGPTAFMRVKGFHAMYARHQEIVDWARKAGATPAGPVYFVYLDDAAVTPEAECRGEIALPLVHEVSSSEGVEVRIVQEALSASVLYEGNASRAPAMWGVVYEWLERNGWAEASPPEKHQLLHDADLGEMDDAFEICVPVKRAS